MSNHHGDTQVQVFVSHKTEDKRLAEKIRDKLLILSNGYIRPNLCYEIPGGKQYIDAKTGIANAMDSPNRHEIIKAINDIRWSNKVLLKKATEVCYKNLDELEPIDMNEN